MRRSPAPRTARSARRPVVLALVGATALALVALLSPVAAADEAGPWGPTGPYARTAPTAPAAPEAAIERGSVTGQILAPGNPSLKVRWFTEGYGQYLGERTVGRDLYSIRLTPGTYVLQFFDTRPAYDLDKLAPSDVTVTVRADRTTQKDVRMRVGAGITGTVKAHGRRAGGATVVAASKDGQSFPVKANGRGQFALGGLPAGSYSVFTYDRRKEWVDKSLYVRGLKLGRSKNVGINLKKKAGSLRVELRTKGGDRMGKTVFVTAVSKATGQFWTEKARGGTVIFRGLYPGRYKLVAPAVGGYLARTGPIQGGKVRPGRADLVSTFTWTERGASISGTVVDEENPAFALAQVQVIAYAATGAELDRDTTDTEGRYVLQGLASQQGVTVVAQPQGDDPAKPSYLVTFDDQGRIYCSFEPVEVDVPAVAAPSDYTEDVALPHSAEQDEARCEPEAAGR